MPNNPSTPKQAIGQYITNLTSSRPNEGDAVKILAATNKILSSVESTGKDLGDWLTAAQGQNNAARVAELTTARSKFQQDAVRIITAGLIVNPEKTATDVYWSNQSALLDNFPGTTNDKIQNQLVKFADQKTLQIDADTTLDAAAKSQKKIELAGTIFQIKSELISAENNMNTKIRLESDPAKKTILQQQLQDTSNANLITVFKSRQTNGSAADILSEIKASDGALFPAPVRADRTIHQAGDDLGKALHMSDDMRSGVGAGADLLVGLTKKSFNLAADGGKWLITPSRDKKYGDGANAMKSLVFAGGATIATVYLLRNVGIEKLPLGTGSVILLGAALTAGVLTFMGTRGHLQGKANFLDAEEAARNSLRNNNNNNNGNGILVPGTARDNLLNNVAFNIQSHDGNELRTEITDPETGEKIEFKIENTQNYAAVAGTGAHLPAEEIQTDNLPVIGHDGFGADYGILSRSQSMKTGAQFSLNA